MSSGIPPSSELSQARRDASGADENGGSGASQLDFGLASLTLTENVPVSRDSSSQGAAHHHHAPQAHFQEHAPGFQPQFYVGGYGPPGQYSVVVQGQPGFSMQAQPMPPHHYAPHMMMPPPHAGGSAAANDRGKDLAGATHKDSSVSGQGQHGNFRDSGPAPVAAGVTASGVQPQGLPATEEELLAVDERVREALVGRPTDAQAVMRLQEAVARFLASDHSQHVLWPMRSYHRLLAHRVADYFCLQHVVDASGQCVVYIKSADTHVSDRLSRLISEATSAMASATSEPTAPLSAENATHAGTNGEGAERPRRVRLMQRRDRSGKDGQPAARSLVATASSSAEGTSNAPASNDGALDTTNSPRADTENDGSEHGKDAPAAARARQPKYVFWVVVVLMQTRLCLWSLQGLGFEKLETEVLLRLLGSPGLLHLRCTCLLPCLPLLTNPNLIQDTGGTGGGIPTGSRAHLC